MPAKATARQETTVAQWAKVPLREGWEGRT